ncbi:uncharacterized protein LOC130052762 [Ostrea edulis]|uniref:uncharacterized protein LOC130052762 n=1 Tax=Ostrea edulis TaxID=37623 RepID=UPI0024AE8907|nr:uncharacterized protein LOC130052762 [Ostrea edulis]XP_056014659.1 uncharacterized protein LOC130052762 [Ostrea edulis]
MFCFPRAMFPMALIFVLIIRSTHGLQDDWQLVFQAVTGNGENVLNAWNSRSPSRCTIQAGCIPAGFKLDNQRDNTKHLRSPLIDKWNSLNILKIRVVFGGQGKTLAYLEFDGSGSTKNDWFSKARLLHSSWSDLKTSKTNYFSMLGDESRVTRHFFINKSYAGCPKDIGWFVVVDKRDVCAWARQGNAPVFLYNKSSKAANWNRDIGVADLMNVYIQTL